MDFLSLEEPEEVALVLHRPARLELTTRWQDWETPIVTPRDWIEGTEVQHVGFHGSAPAIPPLEADVRAVAIRQGDVTGRYITNSYNGDNWVDLPHYGLTDPVTYKVDLENHFRNNCMLWASDRTVAHEELLRLLPDERCTKYPELLKDLMFYDFGRFCKTGTGSMAEFNTLGINRVPEDALTIPGKVPVPRLVVAQSDIISSQILDRYQEKLFTPGCELLERVTTPLDIHITYVVLELIIYGTIWTFCDMYRRGKQHGVATVLDSRGFRDQQKSINALINRFTATLRKGELSYEDVMEGLTASEKAYYRNGRGNFANEPEDQEWKAVEFWIPALHNLWTADDTQMKVVSGSLN